MADQTAQFEAQLAQAQTQREKIDALNDLAWELRDQQPDRALKLAQSASELSTSGEFLAQPYNAGLAVSLTTRGYINLRQEKLDLALDECFSAIDLLGTETPSRAAIDSLRVISWVYYFLGDYANALNYGLKGLDLSRAGGFKIQEASALDGLAVIHAASDDFQQALKEDEVALSLIREEHDEKLEALVLNNIANILLNQGEYVRALEYSQQSLEIVHRLELNERRSEIADTLGQILQKMGEYERAEQLLTETLAMDIATQQELGQAYSLISLGGLHLFQEKLEQAETDFDKSLEIAIKIDARPAQMECYANLIEVAKRQGNWQQAFTYHESFHEIHKEIHIQTTSKRLSILKLVHQVETARRNAEIYHLRNEELSREIEERKRMAAALLESEERYRKITSVISDFSYSIKIDAQGQFLPEWVAGAFTEITGYSFDEYLTSGGWDNLLHPISRSQDIQDRKTLFSNQPVNGSELCITRKDGETRWVRNFAHQVWDEAENRLGGVYGGVQDITLERLAIERLQVLNAELEQRVVERTAALETSNRELESLSYNIAHDMRSPVRALAGYSGMLQRSQGEKLDAEGRANLEMINASSKRLGRLIDDFLAYLRLGQVVPKKQQLHMEPIVIKVKDDLLAQNPNPLIQISIEPLPGCQADLALVEQVWTHLMSNAVKFTRLHAPALIKIGSGKKDGEPYYFIRDNGIGFDMKYADKIFGIFQYLNRQDDYEGTGVGLAIVQRIITRHGGRIWAEAQVDQGATFFFTLGAEHRSPEP